MMFTKLFQGRNAYIFFVLLLIICISGCNQISGIIVQPTLEPTLGPTSSIEQLTSALYSSNSIERGLALEYIKERGSNAAPAVTALINLIRTSPSVDTRVQASSAIGFIGLEAKAAIPALIEQLEQGKTQDDRLVSAGVLGVFGKEAESAIPILTKTLIGDEDELVRSTAAESLGKISSKSETLELLIQQMQVDNSGQVQIGIADGLCAMGMAAKPAIPQLAKNLWWHEAEYHTVKQKAAKAIATIAGVKFHEDNCNKGGFHEFINGELRIVVEARAWWEKTGQYQDW